MFSLYSRVLLFMHETNGWYREKENFCVCILCTHIKNHDEHIRTLTCIAFFILSLFNIIRTKRKTFFLETFQASSSFPHSKKLWKNSIIFLQTRAFYEIYGIFFLFFFLLNIYLLTDEEETFIFVQIKATFKCCGNWAIIRAWSNKSKSSFKIIKLTILSD
jgi:hypothetical protein